MQYIIVSIIKHLIKYYSPQKKKQRKTIKKVKNNYILIVHKLFSKDTFFAILTQIAYYNYEFLITITTYCGLVYLLINVKENAGIGYEIFYDSIHEFVISIDDFG